MIKKSGIWIIAAVMGFSFMALLYLQARYYEEVLEMRSEQFGESVRRGLYQTVRDLELGETHARLAKKLGDASLAEPALSAPSDSAAASATAFQQRMRELGSVPPTEAIFGDVGAKDGKQKQQAEALRREVDEHFIEKQDLLAEEIYAILYEPSDKPLVERLQPLEGTLDRALRGSGLEDAPTYHYVVTNYLGDTILRCPDYDPRGSQYSFRQVLFPSDPPEKKAVLYVHFPDMQRYIFSGVNFIIPAIVFTLVLLCMFIFTIYTLLRQKRLTEIKNDFINNMTHEFKTPISSISLAAQMLSDPAVGKSEKMLAHITGVIGDETKRLRFQVEKVLQMSMFDDKGGTFNLEDVHLNPLLEDVAKTFRLKVESAGGRINTDLRAQSDLILADRMHLTNVVFNLLDNAVKYKHVERNLQIDISSRNKGDTIQVTVRDNGIGVKRDDLKKIFEKFYRAHTGNRHDVKGFGLGLAYVHKVVRYHKGHITADSKQGKFTEFVITLPLIGKK